MKVAYIRSVFPKTSETFILEEIVALRRLGHDVRVYAKRLEYSYIQPKVIESGILSHVLHLRKRLGLLKWARVICQQLTLLILSPRRRGDFFRILLPEAHVKRLLRYRIRFLCRGRSAWTLGALYARENALAFLHSLRIGNLQLGAHQYLLGKSDFTPDVIHCPFTFRWDTRALTSEISRHPGAAYTVALRSRDIYSTMDISSFADLKYRLIKEADRVVTISKYNQDNLLKKRICSAPPAIIHSSIDADFFSPESENRTTGSKKIILSVARLVPKKGLHILIQSCAALKDGGVDFQCRIIGEGPEKKKLRMQIDQLGLKKHVLLLGTLNQREVRTELKSASLFVLPCVIDNTGDRDILPNSLKEAMAMGVPVITSHISGIEELIIGGKNGFLVSPSDPTALAELVLRLFVDNGLRAAIAKSARETILRDYNIKTEASKLVSVLKDAIRLKAIRSEQQAQPDLKA